MWSLPFIRTWVFVPLPNNHRKTSAVSYSSLREEKRNSVSYSITSSSIAASVPNLRVGELLNQPSDNAYTVVMDDPFLWIPVDSLSPVWLWKLNNYLVLPLHTWRSHPGLQRWCYEDACGLAALKGKSCQILPVLLFDRIIHVRRAPTRRYFLSSGIGSVSCAF